MPNQNNTSVVSPARFNLPLFLTAFGILAALLIWCGMVFFVDGHVFLAADSSWHHGFNHPLEGLDHIVVMLLVGVWAAQTRGNAIWLLPLTFVGNMSIGGLAGVLSLAVPGAEAMILLSGVVMCVLVIRKIRFATWMSLLLVAFFAFFHGYAHGQEIPVSASFVSYAMGFVLATMLLHGVGILVFRLAILSMTSFASSGIHAQYVDRAVSPQTATTGLPGKPILLSHASSIILQELTVSGRGDSQLGIADSASEGNIGQEQLKFRPISRPGEVLETVPGLIATQHSGEGKANQFFLRGFNLDHGTDFLTLIEGVPVNQLSHSHGQGWTDTNFLIPELIETLEYKKGSHHAEYGDFSSAGAANIRYFNVLPDKLVKFTGGSFDYYRGLVAGSQKLAGGDLMFAGETVHNDGPWRPGNNYLKFNGVMRYSQNRDSHGWSITGMASTADWRATDQIPRHAFAQGDLGRFDALDPTDGGKSKRFSLTAEWHRQDENSASSVMAYGVYSKLNLFSNFTFFQENNEFTNPAGCSGLTAAGAARARLNRSIFNSCGDQFGQPDQRWTTGFKANHTFFHKIAGADSETIFGLQMQNDNIKNALTRTHAQRQFAITREDTVWVTSLSPYAQNRTYWTPWLRSTMGVRFDGYRFDVGNSNIADNNGVRYDGMFSPKGSIILGPWQDTELYLNGGLGFHSNDARGINTRIDPVSGDAVSRANPLARTYNAEIGVRSTWIKGLQSTFAFWWMDTQSELVFVGDAGTTEASRPGRRYGIEFANYYSPVHWLTLDADFSFSRARFRDDAPEGNRIPNAVETVLATGATVHDVFGGFFGGPRLRFFGPRALIEDNSARSSSTLLLSAMLGYQFNNKLTVQAEVFNLLDRKDDGITYFYSSRLPGEPTGGRDDFHFHPVEPVSFRVGFTWRF